MTKKKNKFVDEMKSALTALAFMAIILSGVIGMVAVLTWVESSLPMKDCYYKQEIQVGEHTTKVLVTDFPCD